MALKGRRSNEPRRQRGPNSGKKNSGRARRRGRRICSFHRARLLPVKFTTIAPAATAARHAPGSVRVSSPIRARLESRNPDTDGNPNR